MMAACPMHKDVIPSHGGLNLYHVTFTEYAAIVHANHDVFLAYGAVVKRLWSEGVCVYICIRRRPVPPAYYCRITDGGT